MVTNSSMSTHLSTRARLESRSIRFDISDGHCDEDVDTVDFLRLDVRRQLLEAAAVAAVPPLDRKQFSFRSATPPASGVDELCLEREGALAIIAAAAAGELENDFR